MFQGSFRSLYSMILIRGIRFALTCLYTAEGTLQTPTGPSSEVVASIPGPEPPVRLLRFCPYYSFPR